MFSNPCPGGVFQQPVRGTIGREVVKRHVLHDDHVGPASVIEKTYFRRSPPLEYRIYKNLPIRSGHRWRLPEIYCLRRGRNFQSIFMEDTERTDYKRFSRSSDGYLTAASVIGEVNAAFIDQPKLHAILPRHRRPQAFLDLTRLEIPVFPDFVDDVLARETHEVRARLVDVFDDNTRLMNALSFSLAHGDMNRSNFFHDPDRGKFLLIDWASAKGLPLGGDLSQLLFSGWWGHLPSGRRFAGRDGKKMLRIEPRAIDAYHRSLNRKDIDCATCALGADLTTAKNQFLKRLPACLSAMTPPESRYDQEHVQKFQENLSIMLAKMRSLIERIERI